MILGLKILFILISIFILTTSLLPRVDHPHWIFRAMEYPGVQKFAVSLISMIALIFLFGPYNHWVLLLIVILFINAISLLIKFFPYLPLGILNSKEIVDTTSKNKECDISFLIANLLQSNDRYSETIDQVLEYKPDVFLCMECNQEWIDQLEKLHDIYPFRILIPRENMYGMALYSQKKLHHSEKRYLVKDDIPSIKTAIEMNSNLRVMFYGLHPAPPSPSESKYSINKDKEMLIIADEISSEEGPVIAAGDFNDVAWSKTTRLFQKASGLLDPRKGRGFFSTFHANYAFMRFPLDHIFISEHFELTTLKRIDACGSDHFHIYAKVNYCETADNKKTQEKTDSEKKEIEKKKNAEPT